MIKMRRSITGYLSPKTKKHGFFILSVCLLACVLNGMAMHYQTTAGMGGKACAKVPILMYHSVLDDAKRESKYVITPADFEKDLQYLKENGFETVTSKDLIAYQENRIALPDKPVMITFDDGYYNTYSYVYPLLKKYEMKAVLAVVGKYADAYSQEGEVMNNNYSHATWQMLREMKESGYVELANHSYDMHDWSKRKGILRKSGEEAAHYREILLADISKMQERLKQNTGKAAVAFTYPFGSVNKESRGIVERTGFKVTYGCEEGVNILTPESSLKELKRYNRDGNEDRTVFFEKINKALEKS